MNRFLIYFFCRLLSIFGITVAIISIKTDSMNALHRLTSFYELDENAMLAKLILEADEDAKDAIVRAAGSLERYFDLLMSASDLLDDGRDA